MSSNDVFLSAFVSSLSEFTCRWIFNCVSSWCFGDVLRFCLGVGCVIDLRGGVLDYENVEGWFE